MREAVDEEGEGGARMGLFRRRRPPPQPPSPSAPSASSSPPAAATEGSTSRSKDKKGEITKAIRDRISSVTRLSCWGNIGTTHYPIRRSGSGSGRGRGRGTPVALTAATPSSCVCVNGGHCGGCCTSNGKAIAPGVRSLVERNDFYSRDCNTHILGTSC